MCGNWGEVEILSGLFSCGRGRGVRYNWENSGRWYLVIFGRIYCYIFFDKGVKSGGRI